jgi:hypothetical protein
MIQDVALQRAGCQWSEGKIFGLQSLDFNPLLTIPLQTDTASTLKLSSVLLYIHSIFNLR